MPHDPKLDSTELARWLDFLKCDPNNPRLLQHAAQAALDAGDLALCREMLDRQTALGSPSAPLLHLRGVLCLSEGDFEGAITHFSSLLEEHDDPTLRYNLAYANAMLGRYDAALAMLHEEVMQSTPPAVTLGVRMLHYLARLDEALYLGQQHIEKPPFDDELPGALATVCFDASRLELARHFAALSPAEPSCQTVLGLLALNDGDEKEAARHLENAITTRPASGRAQIGMGLCLLMRRDFGRAAEMLDSAATTLKTHAGSWVAAGWGHTFAADLPAARSCFERAAHIDRGFAEAPGGLAVVACHEHRFDDARRLISTALRLDSDCMAAAVASSLLASEAGDQARSSAIIQRAMNRQLSADGPTLGSLVSLRLFSESNETN